MQHDYNHDQSLETGLAKGTHSDSLGLANITKPFLWFTVLAFFLSVPSQRCYLRMFVESNDGERRPAMQTRLLWKKTEDNTLRFEGHYVSQSSPCPRTDGHGPREEHAEVGDRPGDAAKTGGEAGGIIRNKPGTARNPWEWSEWGRPVEENDHFACNHDDCKEDRCPTCPP